MDNSKSITPMPRPKGLLAWLLKLPVGLYRAHLGGLLGGRFLMLTHTGRKTGKTHRTVIEVVQYDKETNTYYVVSGWGERSSWYRNILAHPQVTIQVGNHAYPASAERVSPEQGAEVLADYAHKHPTALRELSRIMKYPLDGSEASARELGRIVPVIAFRIR